MIKTQTSREMLLENFATKIENMSTDQLLDALFYHSKLQVTLDSASSIEFNADMIQLIRFELKKSM
jgi:hypothetical protein